MNYKKNISILIFSIFAIIANAENKYPVSNPIKSIPLPPLGQRWVLNEAFTDEFNGTKLDTEKWYDYHPTWIGRQPGLFVPERIKVRNGYLRLSGKKMKEDKIVKAYGKELTFNIECAAVISKEKKAHYGYYECRVKANKTTLSTTFWLASREHFSTEGRQPEGSEKGKFSQELDIMECIGRKGDFSGKYFAEGMNSNVHYWFQPEKGERQDIRAKESRLKREDGKMPSDSFNIYGCWWEDKETAHFYLNNEQKSTTKFIAAKTKKPFYFTEPMSLHLVVETYPFPWIELPNDKELAHPTKTVSLYDWVRAYILVDAKEKIENAKPTIMFEEHINFVEKPNKMKLENGKINFNIAYTANKDAEIIIAIFDSNHKLVSKEIFEIYGGYANDTFSLNLKGTPNKKYYACAYIRPLNDKDNQNAYEGDSFEFTFWRL